MAALAMTFTAMIAAANGYVETPRHQSVRILLGVSRFKPHETPASFASRVYARTCTKVCSPPYQLEEKFEMAHNTHADMGKSIAQEKGRTHSAFTDASQTSATSGGFMSDTPVAPAMPSALQWISSMTRCQQLVRYESLSVALRGPAHHALQFMSMTLR